jgi:hypothetical protein
MLFFNFAINYAVQKENLGRTGGERHEGGIRLSL